MTREPAAFASYLAAWSEQDPSRIRRHLDLSVAENVLFIDPANTTVGPDELETLIRGTRVKVPTATYHRVSGVDGHNRMCRYLWEVRVDGQCAMHGMDVTTLGASDRIESVYGFFGDFPASGS
ncbi:nuclear transport factor 2 family protein [Streptomyces cellostaticus]|uniref:nuclear transport factor 2 family protein n=1 Tax=Streptomyces cellostaticus TaxID=67285 RepID=UPI002025E406|nr:nuclear transport factor 2 family protein [Streptomyces cellostaticus]